MSQAVTVTKESIDAKIAGVYYTCPANDQKPTNYTYPSHQVEMGLITICIIILENGFKVMGESVCVDPNIYDEEKGKHWAYENAYEKIWAFEGYLLKQRLHEQPKPAESASAVIMRSADLSFSEALFALKKGYRVARIGWNSSNQWLSVSNIDTATVPADRFWSPHNHEYAKENGGFAEVLPCITIKDVQGQVQMGWAPSQGNLFANDWLIVE